jgi:lycopene cyclase domain-containing protein
MSLHNWEYFLVLGFTLAFPLYFRLRHPKQPLNENYGHIFWATIITAIPFLVWDVIATQRGHWRFNEEYIVGWKILNLPLEEVLFFFVVPFSCSFLWSVIKHHDSWGSLWMEINEYVLLSKKR